MSFKPGLKAGAGTFLALLVTITLLQLPGHASANSPQYSNWAWDAASGTVDPNSSSLISAFQSYAVVNPNMATNDWAVATADAKSGDPCYAVPLHSGGKLDGTVCIPLGTKPDPDGDGHLTVRDVAAGREHDMWIAHYNTNTQRIDYAEAGVSFPLGAVNEGTAGWGGDAANVPLRRGLVTPEEIQAGAINHTLVFGMPYVGSGTPRWPALHNDGSTAGHIVEGAWLRLDPSLNVSALGLPAWQVTVAKAMQQYGMILRDGSGSLVLYGENPINRGGSSLWNSALGGGGSAFSASFPWSRLQVLTSPPDIPTLTTKAGDFNGDNSVNAADLSFLQSAWHATGSQSTDLNSDGRVDIYDLSKFLTLVGR